MMAVLGVDLAAVYLGEVQNRSVGIAKETCAAVVLC
jgi:hypothetical protein